MKNIVVSVMAKHRQNVSFTDDFGNDRNRYARLVVWATIQGGQTVWIRTVEGGLDTRFKVLKEAMVTKYFNRILGKEIEYEEAKFGNGFFAIKEALPDDCKISYDEIVGAMTAWLQGEGTRIEHEIRCRVAKKAAATRKQRRFEDEEHKRSMTELREKQEKEAEESRQKACSIFQQIPAHVELKCANCGFDLRLLDAKSLREYDFFVDENGNTLKLKNLIIMYSPKEKSFRRRRCYQQALRKGVNL